MKRKSWMGGASPGTGVVLEVLILLCRGAGSLWIPTARSSRDREKAKEKGIEGATSEVYCGLRQDNSREGNSKEEWVREVGAWWVGGHRDFLEAQRT